MNQARPSRYPHLLPEDAELWNDYIEQYSPPHPTFLYDVAVGPGRDPGDSFEDSIRKMALQLSKRRIDVVGVLPDGIDIFELTQSAGLKSLAQAIVYRYWLTVTWQLTIPVSSSIICRSYQPDVFPLLLAHDIGLLVVQPQNHA